MASIHIVMAGKGGYKNSIEMSENMRNIKTSTQKYKGAKETKKRGVIARKKGKMIYHREEFIKKYWKNNKPSVKSLVKKIMRVRVRKKVKRWVKHKLRKFLKRH